MTDRIGMLGQQFQTVVNLVTLEPGTGPSAGGGQAGANRQGGE